MVKLRIVQVPHRELCAKYLIHVSLALKDLVNFPSRSLYLRAGFRPLRIIRLRGTE